MVEYLRKAAGGAMIKGMLLIGLMYLAVSLATAENLPDPTRPPSDFMMNQEHAETNVTAGPVLQSVLISPHRTVAIISGQTLKLGDKFGEAQVVKITENEVVLRTGRNLQTLRLFPTIEKRLNSNQSGLRADRRQQ